jgi:hypothetical protein
MCRVYAGWLALEVVSSLWRKNRLEAFRVFPSLFRESPAR